MRTVDSGATKDWGQAVRAAVEHKAMRIVWHGVEGIGKTSLACQAKQAIALMAKGETGLETLIDAGRLPEIPHFPETMTWADALSQLQWLLTAEHPHRCLIVDTLNGMERLCHEHVCETQFGGRWGKDGFTSYQQGYDVSLADWRMLLAEFDALRNKGMSVICLCHTKVAPFRNPEGADYERYQAAMHPKTWELTARWADMIGFMNFETFVDESNKARPKGKGGQVRMMYTERHAAYDAKNRFGLPEQIELGNSAEEGWNNFTAALKAARQEKGSNE